jgi:4-amino-4-deoxy-L-arabinose transferase-like glycosyltransferase
MDIESRKSVDHANENRCFRLAALGVLALAAVLFVGRLGARSLWSEEVRWAEIPREMQLTGDYLSPTINGQSYYDKPLGSYWLVLLAALPTGQVDEQAARLPCAVSALLAVVLLTSIARRLYDARTALLAGIILATSFSFVFFARTASADMENLTGVLACLWLFLRIEDRPGSWWTIPLWLLMALTSLTKGLLGFVLPILIISAYCSFRRRSLSSSPLAPVLGGEGLGVRGLSPGSRHADSHAGVHTGTTLGVRGLNPGSRHPLTPDPSPPEYRGRGEKKGMDLKTPAWRSLCAWFSDLPERNRWLMNRTSLLAIPLAVLVYFMPFLLSIRTTGSSVGLEMVFRENVRRFFDPVNHRGPVYLYLYVIFGLMAPWSLLLPAALVRSIQTRNTDRFALVYFIATFLFFTLSSSRRSYYLLPILPAGALLVARLLATPIESLAPLARGLTQAGLILLAVVVLVSGAALIPLASVLPAPWDRLPSLPCPAVFGIVWTSSVATIAFALFRFDTRRIALAVGVTTCLFLSYLFLFAIPATESYRTQRAFATAVRDRLGRETECVALFHNHDIVFYLQPPHPLRELNSAEELTEAVRKQQVRWLIVRRRDREQLAAVPHVVVVEETVQPWEDAGQTENKLLLLDCRPSAPVGEATQHLQADGLALLRMELCRKSSAAPHGRDERCRIVSLRSDDAGVARHGVIGVNEVDRAAIGKAGQRRSGALNAQLVPAHVRHLETRQLGEAYHVAGEEVEAAILAVLEAPCEQQLQSEADAEERLVLAKVGENRLHEPGLVQSGDGVAESTDAGQDKLIRLGDMIGIASDDGCVADRLKRLLHAAEIGHAVVDDDDRFHDEWLAFSSGSSFGTPCIMRSTKLRITSMTAPKPTRIVRNGPCPSGIHTNGPIFGQKKYESNTPAASGGPCGNGRSPRNTSCVNPITSPGSTAAKNATTTICQPTKAPAIIIRSASPSPSPSMRRAQVNRKRIPRSSTIATAAPASPVARPRRQLPCGSHHGSSIHSGQG